MLGFTLRPPAGPSNSPMPAWPCPSRRKTGRNQLATRSAANSPCIKGASGSADRSPVVWSSDYPQHRAGRIVVQRCFASGCHITVTCSGLSGKPDLIYKVQIYEQRPFAAVQVEIQHQDLESRHRSGHPQRGSHRAARAGHTRAGGRRPRPFRQLQRRSAALSLTTWARDPTRCIAPPGAKPFITARASRACSWRLLRRSGS